MSCHHGVALQLNHMTVGQWSIEIDPDILKTLVLRLYNTACCDKLPHMVLHFSWIGLVETILHYSHSHLLYVTLAREVLNTQWVGLRQIRCCKESCHECVPHACVDQPVLTSLCCGISFVC